MRKKTSTRAFGIAAALILCLWPAWALAQDGTGIWIYNEYWSFSIVNLTNYPLTYLRASEGAAYPDVGGLPGNDNIILPILDVGSDWQVDPYSTRIWNGLRGAVAAPVHYDGRVTFCIKDTMGIFTDWKFDVVFKKQKGYLIAEYGDWIGLSPYSSTQSWSGNRNGWANGRWVTPIEDNQMHNIMTLIGDRLMVALYSPDNNNVTLVVQQLYEESSPGVPRWDDKWAYVAYALDFVDNDEWYPPVPRTTASVPGAWMAGSHVTWRKPPEDLWDSGFQSSGPRP